MDDRALSELRDLARRDLELAAGAADLRRRDLEVGEIRTRAEAIDAFFADYPDDDAIRRAAVAAANGELEHRRGELEQADAQLSRAREEDARIHAQHAVDRARDHIAVAETSLYRAETDLAELEREAAALPDELSELEGHADGTAKGAQGLIEWASRQHAELFVAAGQLDSRRERVVREAHELATMLLGEPTYGVTVAQALERVESARSETPH